MFIQQMSSNGFTSLLRGETDYETNYDSRETDVYGTTDERSYEPYDSGSQDFGPQSVTEYDTQSFGPQSVTGVDEFGPQSYTR